LEERAGYFDSELLEFLESKGRIEDWETIANEHNIFPTYLTEHMTDEETSAMNKKHSEQIEAMKKQNFKPLESESH